jgi:hypothetical protein
MDRKIERDNIWLKGNLSLDVRRPRVSGINGTTIRMCESRLIVYVSTSRVFESMTSMTRWNGFVISYSTSPSSPAERISNVPCLELGEVNVPTDEVWPKSVSRATSSWR